MEHPSLNRGIYPSNEPFALTRPSELVHRYEVVEHPLLNPQVTRDLRIVTPHLLDEALGVLATDEYVELDAN